MNGNSFTRYIPKSNRRQSARNLLEMGIESGLLSADAERSQPGRIQGQLLDYQLTYVCYQGGPAGTQTIAGHRSW